MNRLINRESAPLARWRLLDDEFGRSFDNFFSPIRWIEEAAGQSISPAVDVVERENDFLVRTDLPGIKKEDINVVLEDGVLTISAESKFERDEKNGDRLVRQERHYGRYVRSLRLGTQVDDKKVKANYRDGVLELTLPKAEEAKPKKISVDVN
jgi:HSP20 family protein